MMIRVNDLIEHLSMLEKKHPWKVLHLYFVHSGMSWTVSRFVIFNLLKFLVSPGVNIQYSQKVFSINLNKSQLISCYALVRQDWIRKISLFQIIKEAFCSTFLHIYHQLFCPAHYICPLRSLFISITCQNFAKIVTEHTQIFLQQNIIVR